MRGRKKKGFPPFSLRARKSLSLSKAYRAGQGKDRKRLGSLSARLIAKTSCDMYERFTSQFHLGEMKEVDSSDANTKSFRFIVYSIVFLLSFYF